MFNLAFPVSPWWISNHESGENSAKSGWPFCPYGTLPNWAISTGLDPKIATVNHNALVIFREELQLE
jgi:hypothetical protein